MNVANSFFNFLLAALSFYALCTLSWGQHPYGSALAGLGLIHGLMGLTHEWTNDDDAEYSLGCMVSDCLMDALPLAMINIELYLRSSHEGLALLHALAVVPLLFDLMIKLSDECEYAADRLIELSLLANVASMGYLAAAEGSYCAGTIAAVTLLAHYGARLLMKFDLYVDEQAALIAHATSIGLMTLALSRK